jgi:NitT/TauT family transport system substrate-binding protein
MGIRFGRRMLVPSLAAVLALGIAACGSNSGGSGSHGKGDSAAPDKLTVAIYGNDLTFNVPYSAAAPDGALTKALKKYGTTVSFVQVASASNLTAALAGGSAQLAVVNGPSILASVAKGLDVVPLVDMFTGPAVTFLGAKKYEASRGSDIKAYDGSRWAYTKNGSTTQLLAEAKVKSIGLKWSDQKTVQLGSGANSQTVLSSGRSDMLSSGGASAATAIDDQIGYVVHNTQTDPDSPYSDMLTAELAATSSFTKMYPAFTQDVVTSIVQTLLEPYKTSTDGSAVYDSLPSDVQKAVKPIFPTQWRLFSSGFTRATGGFSAKALDQTLQLGKDGGLLPGDTKLDPASVFKNKWVLTAYQKLGKTAPAGIS